MSVLCRYESYWHVFSWPLPLLPADPAAPGELEEPAQTRRRKSHSVWETTDRQLDVWSYRRQCGAGRFLKICGEYVIRNSWCEMKNWAEVSSAVRMFSNTNTKTTVKQDTASCKTFLQLNLNSPWIRDSASRSLSLQLYTIHVIQSGGCDKTPAIITRRYSDFQRLHAILRRHYGDQMERVCFPRKWKLCHHHHGGQWWWGGSGLLSSWLYLAFLLWSRQVRSCAGTSQRRQSPSGAGPLSNTCLTCVRCPPCGGRCVSDSSSTWLTCRLDSCSSGN